MARVEPRPGGAPARPLTDALLRRFARAVLGILFRDVSLVGAENLPASGPVIAIANHSNSIMDGAVLLGFLPRIPRFLAASTVWDYKPIAPFMNASGAVKVFRRQDGRAHEGSLEASFSEAATLLADGGLLAVFPEGRTHDDPVLLPFKTGTARIAQFTVARHPGLNLAVVPVGIDYEVKNLLRTRVCFTFGAPVQMGPGVPTGREAARDGDRAAQNPGEGSGPALSVRAVTASLQRALGAVAPDFPNAEAARTATLAAEILALEPGSAPGRPPAFAEVVTRRHAVEAALFHVGASAAADRAEAARAALSDYATALESAGLGDHEVAAPPPAAALARSALALIPGLPVVLVAALFCLPQALLLTSVSRTKPRDRQLTWITFGGVVVYPLTWLAWAAVLGVPAGVAFGAGWAWAVAGAVLVLAPVSARLALPTIDRGWRVVRALRARRLLRQGTEGSRLASLRDRAQIALDALLAGRAV